MNKSKKPWLVSVFKGEGRILIIPMIDHVSGYSVDVGWFSNLNDSCKNTIIGNGILDGFKHIKNAAVSTVNLNEYDLSCVWRQNTKYKSWLSFWKNNYCAHVLSYRDGSYVINSLKKTEDRKGGYYDSIKKIELPPCVTANEIGQAIIDVFKASEEYYAQAPAFDPYPSKSLSLLDGSTLMVKQPSDKHFQDVEDNGAAEIYQCYSYLSSEDAESSADFYVGIAPELDCNLSKENIQSAWEELHGKADFFEVKVCEKGIFTLSAEMKNKNIHKKSYFLQMEEDLLLECSMDIYQPNRRKKLDEKLSVLFEEFALNCKK